MQEVLAHKTVWRIDKFSDPDGKIAEALKAGASVEEILKTNPDAFLGSERIEDNILLNEGITEIWNLVIGASANHFDNSNAQIGVGDSTTAEDATQTDLLGTNTAYVGMDAGYPQVSGNKVSFRATFDGNTGNFDWNEFTVKHGTSGINLNRKVEAKGTKASGETWTVTVEITLS